MGNKDSHTFNKKKGKKKKSMQTMHTLCIWSSSMPHLAHEYLMRAAAPTTTTTKKYKVHAMMKKIFVSVN